MTAGMDMTKELSQHFGGEKQRKTRPAGPRCALAASWLFAAQGCGCRAGRQAGQIMRWGGCGTHHVSWCC